MGLLEKLRPRPDPLERVARHIEVLAEEIGHLRKEQRAGVRSLLERIVAVMATITDLRNALQGLGNAIAAELEQLKQVLLEQGGVPQDVIDEIDATTAKVANLVEDAMPAPEPGPNPNPEPEPPAGRR